MKCGLCGGFDKLMAAKAAGFDYLEPPVTSVAAMTEADFAACLAAVQEAKLPTLAFNALFPRTLPLLNDAVTDADIAAYLEKAFARVQALGGRMVVFGSGKSRNRPENMPYGAAFRRLAEVARLTGKIAAKYGLTIALEPLDGEETNIINTVAEGACLAAAADQPNVRLLADYYHMAKFGDRMEDIVRVGGLAHVHMATCEGRRYPAVMEPGFSAFFKALKDTRYEGMVSVEGKTEDLAADGPAALTLMKQLWAEA